MEMKMRGFTIFCLIQALFWSANGLRSPPPLMEVSSSSSSTTSPVPSMATSNQDIQLHTTSSSPPSTTTQLPVMTEHEEVEGSSVNVPVQAHCCPNHPCCSSETAAAQAQGQSEKEIGKAAKEAIKEGGALEREEAIATAEMAAQAQAANVASQQAQVQQAMKENAIAEQDLFDKEEQNLEAAASNRAEEAGSTSSSSSTMAPLPPSVAGTNFASLRVRHAQKNKKQHHHYNHGHRH